MNWSPGSIQSMTVGNVDLECVCHGPPPAEAFTIVLLHEGLGCVALWRDFPERLAAETGMGVFAYSRQGYGHSSPASLPRPLDFMTREAVDVLPQVLDQAGVRRGILFGHSDGATISAIHAGSVADHRVRGLIVAAPHFFTEEIGLAEIARARASFNSGGLRERLSRYHNDPDAVFRGWSDVWLDPEFRSWNVAEVLDYIRVPVLAIQGRSDQYGTMAQIDEIETRAYCPVDRVELDCRHSPHLEAPDAVLEAVGEFCARLTRIEAAQVEPA